MYTHWANSVRFLRDRCPAVRLITTDLPCAEHIPLVDNYTAFSIFAKKAATSMNDKDSYLLRYGILIPFENMLLLLVYYNN